MSDSENAAKAFFRGAIRTGAEFFRNCAVTLSLPLIDLLRAAGAFELPRPVPPRLRVLTENPAGRSFNSLVVRLGRKLAGRSVGAPRPVLSKLSRVAAGGRPVVIGPWLSEVGFEVLYWIPFLQWAVREHGIAADRIMIISRGGAEAWYRHLGGKYVDILDHFTPAEFMDLNQRRISASGHQKHMELGESDRLILDRICAAENMRGYDVIHPALMYQLLLPLWQRRAPPALALSHAVYLPMVAPHLKADSFGLPESYTAAKFYFSDAFPNTSANVEKVRRVLRAYLSDGPVVLLTSGVRIDDHSDLLQGLPDGITVISPDEPSRNLSVQTAVLAGAKRFVGTYGGFSYLAPLLGIPSLCVYSDPGRLVPVHMDVAFRVFRQFACGHSEKGCVPQSTGELPTARFTAIHIDALADIPAAAGYLV